MEEQRARAQAVHVLSLCLVLSFLPSFLLVEWVKGAPLWRERKWAKTVKRPPLLLSTCGRRDERRGGGGFERDGEEHAVLEEVGPPLP